MYMYLPNLGHVTCNFVDPAHCHLVDFVNHIPYIDIIFKGIASLFCSATNQTQNIFLTMNNDRLSSLALMHIHCVFSVELDKVMEKFMSAKTRRTDFGQF